MNEREFDLPAEAWIVQPGRANELVEALRALPFLEVTRKTWRDGDFEERVWLKPPAGERAFITRLKRGFFEPLLCRVSASCDGREYKICGADNFSPLGTMDKLRNFDAVQQYLAVLEQFVDTDFNYAAERRRKGWTVGLDIVTITASMIAMGGVFIIMVQKHPNLAIGSIGSIWGLVPTLPYLGLISVLVGLMFYTLENVEAAFDYRQDAWWLIASQLKKRSGAESGKDVGGGGGTKGG